MYIHNFFVIDQLPSGRDFDGRFPFERTTTGDLRDLAEARGNHFPPLNVLDGAPRVRTERQGCGGSAADDNIHGENRKTAAGLTVTADHPPSNTVFWYARTVVSPEAYIDIYADRGQPMAWKIVNDFYLQQPVNK